MPTVTDELNVRGIYVLDTFNEYLDNTYWVNRKYQRKLVWTLEEKQSFIDTILHNYPVPIFLMARYKLEEDNKYRKDIIDGLQRLNAIFSFIKNEFPIKWSDGNYYYFNVSALADSERMITEGILIQRENKLDSSICRNFLNYQLPITTTEVSDSEIEDIFIRINSTGRKLSTQDLRQAGAIGLFSDLVRKTSCYIRGDISENDLVLLSQMPSLSLSNRKLNYEIDIKETFWLKNRILTEKNIRISRDEEIVARIYSYMILGNKTSPSSNALNRMYDIESKQNQKLNQFIEKYGLYNLMDDFSKVYSDFNKIFNSVGSDFSSWIFKNFNTKGKAKIFQAMFLSLYELKKEMYSIKNYEEIADSIKYIGDKEFTEITDDEEWNVEVRNSCIRRIKSIIQPLMTKIIHAKGNEEWKLKLESLLLSASGVESQMYDFKLGITVLETGKRSVECISKITKTLTAMANTNPEEDGVILIGVANDIIAAKNHKKHYNVNWIEVGRCFVTGVDCEVKKYWKNLEEYIQFIKREISKQKIQDDVKSQILTNFKVVSYEEKTIIVIKCKNNGHSFTYNNAFYERRGSNTEKVDVSSPAFNELILRTTKKIN